MGSVGGGVGGGGGGGGLEMRRGWCLVSRRCYGTSLFPASAPLVGQCWVGPLSVRPPCCLWVVAMCCGGPIVGMGTVWARPTTGCSVEPRGHCFGGAVRVCACSGCTQRSCWTSWTQRRSTSSACHGKGPPPPPCDCTGAVGVWCCVAWCGAVRGLVEGKREEWRGGYPQRKVCAGICVLLVCASTCCLPPPSPP